MSLPPRQPSLQVPSLPSSYPSLPPPCLLVFLLLPFVSILSYCLVFQESPLIYIFASLPLFYSFSYLFFYVSSACFVGLFLVVCRCGVRCFFFICPITVSLFHSRLPNLALKWGVYALFSCALLFNLVPPTDRQLCVFVCVFGVCGCVIAKQGCVMFFALFFSPTLHSLSLCSLI